jgi:hypothetical protein
VIQDIAHNAADCGVFGGWPYLAYQYVIHVGGLNSEQAYPYCVGTGQCYPCMAPGFNKTLCGPPPSYCNHTEWPCRDVRAVVRVRARHEAHVDGRTRAPLWRTLTIGSR